MDELNAVLEWIMTEAHGKPIELLPMELKKFRSRG